MTYAPVYDVRIGDSSNVPQVEVSGIITTTVASLGEWTYNVPFSNGLTLKTIGNSLDATVLYE